MSDDVLARDEDAARASDLWDLVDSLFPGARLTARRTPQEFTRYWSGLGRHHADRKQSETMAAVRLEQLQQQQRQTPVATTVRNP